MKTTLFSMLCLCASAVYGASMWDCVKPLQTDKPVVKSSSPATPVVQSTSESFWAVVQPISPPTPTPPTPTPPTPTPPTADEEIVKGISTEIAEKIGEGIDIRVECEGGVVTIIGTVSNETQLQKIALIAQSSAGVKNVTNNATVKVEVKEEDKVDGGQVDSTTNTRYAPRRIFRFRSGGCTNGACSR